MVGFASSAAGMYRTDRQPVPVPFSVHEFRGKSRKWAAAESEVSPSNFIFAAKDVICCDPVPPADKNEI
jgi:hypothetical protein